VAGRIAAKPPEAVAITKRLLTRTDGSVADRMAEEGQLFEQRLQSGEAVEAFRAFFEKRTPNFG
jgi:enoyl-CoA hydratase/carnithine racemase